MSITVTLTHAEMWNACCVGLQRRLISMCKGLNKNKHAAISNYTTDIEGAVAEACFAKHMGLYWGCHVNSFKAPDVGSWQVRSTSHASGHLIVRPNDKPPGRVAMLTTEKFGAVLHGWIDIDSAKVDKYWHEDSWWVPQCDLTPFDVEEPA
jgi:hypothetical protein